MSLLTVLVRAHLASIRNHVGAHAGGRRSLAALVLAAGILLIGYNVLAHGACVALLGDMVSVRQAADVLIPVLPIVMALPAFAITLVLTMLLPVESPVTLHARVLGASRLACGISEFLLTMLAAWTATLAALIGPFVYLAGISSAPLVTFVSVTLLALILSQLCIVTMLVVARAFDFVRSSPREARLWGVLASTLALFALSADVIDWAATHGHPARFSTTAWLTTLWGSDLPRSGFIALTLAVVCVALTAAGALLSRSDRAGGFLRPTFVMSTPLARTVPGTLIVTSLAAWSRDSTSRVSLGAMLVLDAGVACGVRLGALDPGVALMLFVVIAATGAELVIGRMRAMTWLLRAMRVPDTAIFALYAGLTFVLLVSCFTASLGAAGLFDAPPVRIAEAYSLFTLVFTMALAAGSIIPYDPTASLGMFATSGLALIGEILALAILTGVFRLDGGMLIAADLTAAVACIAVGWTAFRGSHRRGP